ncbi:methyl-accepting chemotaxis protein [Azohydromonas aeria]|uniref:methyl-accepting chemotaxis protein n=1 Tax=Azohydromonas aeria TaxID=2590212 RepID=UPI0012F7CE8B|nr:methyl-accepting chemotaxis protein [Azohydromonas aeria]
MSTVPTTHASGPSAASRPHAALPWLEPVRQYFAYHGLLAPAVRLMRNLSMRGKVALTTALFMLPLLLLAGSHLAWQQRLLRHTHIELAALEYAEAAQQVALHPGDGARRAALEQARRRATQAGLPEMAAWPQLQAGAQEGAALERSLSVLRREVLRVSALGLQEWGEGFHLSRLGLFLVPDLQQSIRNFVASAPAERGVPEAMVLRLLFLARDAHEGSAGELPRAEADKAFEAVEKLLRLDPEPDALRAQSQAALDAVEALRGKALQLLEHKLRQRADAVVSQQVVLVLGVLAALLVTLYLQLAFYKVLSGGLQALRREMGQLADGNLSARPRPRGRDEVAATMWSLSSSLARLSDLLAAVRRGVGAAGQASQQIAMGNEDLADRTRRATQGLDQVVQGVTQYAAQAQHSVARVDEAAASVQALRLEAARSRKHMAQLAARMQALQGKSRDIEAIVGTIDAIALRTGILALNASVEAGKAGAAGRGFAVVAQEVRSLALRSAESARQIGELIGRATEDIGQGSALSAVAGASIAASEGHVDGIQQAMAGIVELSRTGHRQSTAILEELRSLHAVTAENGALVDELTRASLALREQGEQLNAQVQGFKLC